MSARQRFAHRLALALGQPNPAAMLARMPYQVYLGWVHYAALEPFGEERADLRAAIIAATMANVMGREKGKPAYRVEQFMPKFGLPTPKKPLSGDEMFQRMKLANTLMGGTFIDKRKPADGH